VNDWLTVYLKGFFMGAADAVPGVSGGTIALITGIYDRLVAAIAGLGPGLLAEPRRLRSTQGRRGLAMRLRKLDLLFLIVLAAGILTAIVSVARLLAVALEDYPVPTYAVFFGLIAASAVVLYREVSVSTPRRMLAAVVGFTGAFVLTGITAEAGLPHSLPVIFASGFVALMAMILPGISGAFVLLILGQYPYLTGILRDFTDDLAALATGNGSVGPLLGPGIVVAVFAAGGLLGLLLMSRFVRWALEHHRPATLTFLVSLMVGALRLPGTRIVQATETWDAGAVAVIAGAAIAGAAAVLLLERWAGALDYRSRPRASGTDGAP
jgi:putative membrane protein